MKGATYSTKLVNLVSVHLSFGFTKSETARMLHVSKKSVDVISKQLREEHYPDYIERMSR
jgi:Mn-dependent DtxR family transcriptional regulator